MTLKCYDFPYVKLRGLVQTMSHTWKVRYDRLVHILLATLRIDYIIYHILFIILLHLIFGLHFTFNCIIDHLAPDVLWYLYHHLLPSPSYVHFKSQLMHSIISLIIDLFPRCSRGMRTVCRHWRVPCKSQGEASERRRSRSLHLKTASDSRGKARAAFTSIPSPPRKLKEEDSRNSWRRKEPIQVCHWAQ